VPSFSVADGGLNKVAQVLIRNVDDSVVERLKARAKRNGVSLQAELRDILQREAMPQCIAEVRGILGELDKRTEGRKLADGIKLLRKDRGYDE
jgi:plasmid stability protein